MGIIFPQDIKCRGKQSESENKITEIGWRLFVKKNIHDENEWMKRLLVIFRR